MFKPKSLVAPLASAFALLIVATTSSAVSPQSYSFSLGNGVVGTWIASPYGRTLAITNNSRYYRVCEILSADGRWVRLQVGPGGYVYMENPAVPLRAGCYS